MKTVYIVIWHEAIDVEDLVAGIFYQREQAEHLHENLLSESSGDYWEIIEKEIAD